MSTDETPKAYPKYTAYWMDIPSNVAIGTFQRNYTTAHRTEVQIILVDNLPDGQAPNAEILDKRFTDYAERFIGRQVADRGFRSPALEANVDSITKVFREHTQKAEQALFLDRVAARLGSIRLDAVISTYTHSEEPDQHIYVAEENGKIRVLDIQVAEGQILEDELPADERSIAWLITRLF